MKLTKREVCTIPNLLSLIRLLLIPVFCVVYLTADSSQDAITAALIVLFSSLTDLFDGWIARNFNQISELGKFLDPLADKLTHIAVAVCMAFRIEGMLYLMILLMCKEAFMGVAGLIILKKNGRKLDGAKWFGKLSTTVFDIVLFILLFFYPLFLSPAAVRVLLVIAAVFLLLSLCLYAREFVRMYHLPRKTETPES